VVIAVQGTDQAQRTSHWKGLVELTAAVDLLVVLAVGVSQREREAVAMAIVLALGLALFQVGTGRAGRIVLALMLVNVEVWMLPAAVSGVAHHDSILTVAISVGLAVSSLLGLIGLSASAVGRRDRAHTPVAVGIAGVVVFFLAVAGSALAPTATSDRPASAVPRVSLSTRDTQYSTARLTARPGPVAVQLTNRDLFWHTFTINGRGVDLKVPGGGTRQMTAALPAGVYQFYCRIPGHKQAGMHGTFVIQ
jgi:plastocyanin